jgi:hypothetical protein
MDEVRKPSNSACYTPSSEPYRIYLLITISHWNFNDLYTSYMIIRQNSVQISRSTCPLCSCHYRAFASGRSLSKQTWRAAVKRSSCCTTTRGAAGYDINDPAWQIWTCFLIATCWSMIYNKDFTTCRSCSVSMLTSGEPPRHPSLQPQYVLRQGTEKQNWLLHSGLYLCSFSFFSSFLLIFFFTAPPVY